MIAQETNHESKADQRKRLRASVAEAIDQKNAVALTMLLSELTEGGGAQADYTFVATQLKALSSDDAKKLGLKPLRVFIARSVTVEPLMPNVVVHAACAGLRIEYEIGGYGSFIEELMSSDCALGRFQPDAVLFLSDIEDVGGGLEDACASGDERRIQDEIRQTSTRIEHLLKSLRSHSKARFVFQGFVCPDHPVLGELADTNMSLGETKAVRQINEAAAGECRKAGDAVFSIKTKLPQDMGAQDGEIRECFAPQGFQ